MVASLTDKPKQRNPNHPRGHRLERDHPNTGTGRPAKGNPWLAKVTTGGSIYVQISKVMKAIAISDDRKSNKEWEQGLKQQPMDKQLVVETDEDEDDKDMDDEDEEDEYMPYISRDMVHGYVESIIGHPEEYTWPPYRDTGLSEEAICISCLQPPQNPSSESTKDCWRPANITFNRYGTTPALSQSSPTWMAPDGSTKTWRRLWIRSHNIFLNLAQ